MSAKYSVATGPGIIVVKSRILKPERGPVIYWLLASVCRDYKQLAGVFNNFHALLFLDSWPANWRYVPEAAGANNKTRHIMDADAN